MVLDRRLRVLAVLDDEALVPDVLNAPPDDTPPPILVVPRVFEPGFCARLLPEIRRAFQFTATRIERYLVACYDATGHFGPHRDNTTKGTAFSCALLHEATPVTEGRRYCTVPFLYDEAGEELRRRNLAYVAQ